MDITRTLHCLLKILENMQMVRQGGGDEAVQAL